MIEVVPTRSSKEHDIAMNALRIMEQAIGEHLNGAPYPHAGKNPVAVAFGKLGEDKDEKARAGSTLACQA